MGVWVLGSTAYQLLVLGLPRAEVMGAIGFLALAAAPPAAPPRHQQRLLPTLPLPRQTAEITQFLGSLLVPRCGASAAVRGHPDRPLRLYRSGRPRKLPLPGSIRSHSEAEYRSSTGQGQGRDACRWGSLQVVEL